MTTPRRRRLPVVLSPKAKDDQQSILLHGITTWGEAQAAAYEAALDRALEHLGTYPDIGRRRDDLAPGMRGLPVEQHLILYRVETDAVQGRSHRAWPRC